MYKLPDELPSLDKSLRLPKFEGQPNDLRKLGNFKKILEMLGLDDKYQLSTQKPNFDFFGKNCKIQL